MGKEVYFFSTGIWHILMEESEKFWFKLYLQDLLL